MMAGALRTLTVVSERYPAPGEPVFTFVHNLVAALCELGVEVTVVSPQSVTRALVRGGARMPRDEIRRTDSGTRFRVVQPLYMTFSARFGGVVRALANASYRYAVKRALSKLPAPDAVYAHFWRSGIAAGLCASGANVFVGCGESQVKREFTRDVRSIAASIGGVVSVSGKNKADCVSVYGLEESDIIVLPNGVDERVFYPREDRGALREGLGLTDDDFVVAFVGWFNERKGVKRLEAALDGLDGVKAIYIGYGDLEPRGENIAFVGRVDHEDVAKYLNAADVFALPTRAEGCCNAIVEAMACGLPVISSSGAFNDDLLSDENSIRVDPDDVGAIRDAVLKLKGDPERVRAMRASARAFAEGLTIKRRAERVKAFIESRI